MFGEVFFNQFCLKTDQFCQNHFFKWFFVIVIVMKQVRQSVPKCETYD